MHSIDYTENPKCLRNPFPHIKHTIDRNSVFPLRLAKRLRHFGYGLLSAAAQKTRHRPGQLQIYIYEKQTKTEHLYDVVNDPEKNLDLHKTVMHDKERNRNVLTRQVLFYHDWDKAEEEFVKLRAIKDSIWKDGTLWERIKYGSWRMVIYNFRRKIKSIQHAFM